MTTYRRRWLSGLVLSLLLTGIGWRLATGPEMRSTHVHDALGQLYFNQYDGSKGKWWYFHRFELGEPMKVPEDQRAGLRITKLFNTELAFKLADVYRSAAVTKQTYAVREADNRLILLEPAAGSAEQSVSIPPHASLMEREGKVQSVEWGPTLLAAGLCGLVMALLCWPKKEAADSQSQRLSQLRCPPEWDPRRG